MVGFWNLYLQKVITSVTAPFIIIFRNNDKTNNYEKDESVEILSTKYYTLSGKEVENPSGLTIVVKRLSNGKVLTEKKLFR